MSTMCEVIQRHILSRIGVACRCCIDCYGFSLFFGIPFSFIGAGFTITVLSGGESVEMEVAVTLLSIGLLLLFLGLIYGSLARARDKYGQDGRKNLSRNMTLGNAWTLGLTENCKKKFTQRVLSALACKIFMSMGGFLLVVKFCFLVVGAVYTNNTDGRSWPQGLSIALIIFGLATIACFVLTITFQQWSKQYGSAQVTPAATNPTSERVSNRNTRSVRFQNFSNQNLNNGTQTFYSGPPPYVIAVREVDSPPSYTDATSSGDYTNPPPPPVYSVVDDSRPINTPPPSYLDLFSVRTESRNQSLRSMPNSSIGANQLEPTRY